MLLSRKGKEAPIRHCPVHDQDYTNQAKGLWACPVDGCFYHDHDEDAEGYEIVFCMICNAKVWEGKAPNIESDEAFEKHWSTHSRLRRLIYHITKR